MSNILSINTVLPKSEKLCTKWGGEFKGEICVWVEIKGTSVILWVEGKAKRIGSFKESFKFNAACYTILDVGIGKLKFCLSGIEWEDGLPRCFRIKIKAELGWAGKHTLINEKICLFGILGIYGKSGGFDVNTSAADDAIVLCLGFEPDERYSGCNCG